MSPEKKTTHLLLDASKNSYRLRLEESPDGLTCLASIPTGDPEKQITSQAFNDILKRLSLVGDIDLAAIDQFCQQAQTGEWPLNVPVMHGTPPGEGTDGFLELEDRAQDRGAIPDYDVEGSVDLHQVQFFDNVLPGQEIGRIVPPEQGTNGETISGKLIPGLLGKEASVKLGAGIGLDDESGVLTATLSGRIVHEGERLLISEIYEVHGDVDYAIGSIHFNGEIKIHGDVLDGFSLYATKNITIDGHVGNCHITSKGDIQMGSMAGHGQGFVRCDGTVKAHYLSDVKVEVEGDVLIQNEIRNSQIKARGIISIPNGALVGGEAIALRGIDAQTIGGPSCVLTRLMPGTDFAALDRKRFLLGRQEEMRADLQRILNLVGTIRDRNPTEDEELPNVQRLLDRYEALGNTLVVIEAELERYLGHRPEAANPKINVRHTLYEGVIIEYEGYLQRIAHDEDGAYSILPDLDAQQLRFLSLTPIDAAPEPPLDGDENPAA